MKQNSKTKPLAKWIIPFAILTTIMSHTAISQESESYPQPVLETVERTGPNTMEFLSYPKYYRDANNDLQLADTTLRPSGDPNWDYQVTAGIWQLFVSRDGRFQAKHKGDVFIYRFASLGYGRGSQFRAVDLGTPDFSRFEVNGDRIRWRDVFTDVDLEVRYIHDILKVDVILRNAFMQDLKDVLRNGELNPDEYLTARFDIDAVILTSEIKRNGVTVNPYSESLDINQPLSFEKNGETVHRLRPVETYLLDGTGERIEEESTQFRTANTWQLRQNAPGLAELSVYLADLQELPDGDLVIDPSMYWSTTTNNDTMLEHNSSNLHGSDTSVEMHDDDHLLLGFWLSGLTENSIILSASVQLTIGDNSLNNEADAIFYPVTQWWAEQGANWYNYTTGQAWSSSGGDYNNQGYFSRSFQIPTSSNTKIDIDISQPFKKHYIDDPDYMYERGFLLKMEEVVTGTVEFFMLDDTTVSNRPLLAVCYAFTQFGADAGNIGAGYGTRMDNMNTDNLKIIRFF